MKRFLIAAVVAAGIASPLTAQTMTPGRYVATAGASDLYERTSSQIVLKSTRNPRVRSFAQMMITAHSKSTADVKAAAAQSRVRTAPAKLSPAQAGMVAQLRARSGAARDAAYIAQQRTAHDQALAVQQGYANTGTAPALRRAAAGIVPVVKRHIAELRRM